MAQPFGRSVLAIILAVLFGVLLVPRDLLHACSVGHSDQETHCGDHDAQLSASCGICDLALPHFLGTEVPGIQTAERTLFDRCAPLVEQWALVPVTVPCGRGPPWVV